MRNRDVIKSQCVSDSLTPPEECEADAGGDTSRWMNVHLSAGPTDHSSPANCSKPEEECLKTSLERTTREEALCCRFSGGIVGQLH